MGVRGEGRAVGALGMKRRGGGGCFCLCRGVFRIVVLVIGHLLLRAG